MEAEVQAQVETIQADHWPVPWADALPDWLDDFYVELPRKYSPLHSELLGIVASHESRHATLHAWWEESLELALGHARRTQRTIFFSAVSPYADRLRHACVRFGVPHLELRCDTDHVASNDRCAVIRWHSGNPSFKEGKFSGCKFEDRGIAILSHQLFGLHVRHGGRIMRLIQARLDERTMTPGSTMVVLGRRFSPRRSSAQKSSETLFEISSRGAVLWLLSDRVCQERDSPNGPDSPWRCQPRSSPATWMPVGRASGDLLQSEAFLIHFTRARQGAWPDQSQSQLFDEAIRLEWRARCHPLETLHRILVSQRLVASSFLRRGVARTVCFTSNSLSTALSMRQFQAHVGRWDWEPYGLAIRADWLEARGARPVRYLPSDRIPTLTENEQSFAQPLPKDDRHRDWTVEREWRVLDDIRLCQIPSDQAFLFVRSHKEASTLSPWSRWPIVFLSPDA